MYKELKVRVRVNGTLFGTQGTKQGDPLSPQLFALCIKPLPESIRQNTVIMGLTITEEEHKIALYADDLIYLTDIYISLVIKITNLCPVRIQAEFE